MYSQAVYIYELYETGVCGTGQELWDIDLFMNSIFAQKLSSPRSSLPVNWHTYLVQLRYCTVSCICLLFSLFYYHVGVKKLPKYASTYHTSCHTWHYITNCIKI